MYVLGIAVVCMVVLRPETVVQHFYVCIVFMVVLRPTTVVKHLYVCIGHCCCFYGGIKAKESVSEPVCMYWTLLLLLWWY